MNITKESRMSEKDYRNLSSLNYSSIKLYNENLKKFYKQVVLKEKYKEDEPEGKGLLIGALVDCLILTPVEFDNKFIINSCIPPQGQMLDFCNQLYACTLKYLSEDNEVTVDFNVIFEEAVEKVKAQDKFKGKDAKKILELFLKVEDGVSAKNFYDNCRASFGKTSVDINTMGLVEKIVNSLKESEYTREDILQNHPDKVYYPQLAIEWIDSGINMKALLDLVVVDNVKKEITPKDLKIVYDLSQFQWFFYKNGYWLQACHYIKAIEYWAEINYPGYKINDFEFIVGDSSLSNIPMIYKTNILNYNQAEQGFYTSSGKFQKGWLQLVEEIKWHYENAIWDRSKECFENNGKIVLNPF